MILFSLLKDFENLGAKKVAVVTDSNIVKLPAFSTALDSLTKSGVSFDVFDKTRVEPTNTRCFFFQFHPNEYYYSK